MPSIGSKFTAKGLSGIKEPGTYTDKSHTGLQLRISDNGNRVWRLRYKVDGQTRVYRLCGDLALADVLERYRAAKAELDGGGDPAARKQAEKLEQAKQQTIADLADDWLALKVVRLREKTRYDYKHSLTRYALPALGKFPLEQLDRALLAKWQAKIAKQHGDRTATLSLAVVKSMLSWAVEQGRLEISPAAAVKPVTRHTPKDRALSEAEIVTFWRYLDEGHVHATVTAGLRLILLTGCRPGEVAAIHRREIDGDWWTIPAKRSKNGKEHRVFLTDTAKGLLGEADGYLLPAVRREPGKPPAPLDSNLFSKATRRMAEVLAERGVEPFTPHDLRRSAATHVARIGHGAVVPDLLNHSPAGITRQVYDRYGRDDEKRHALLCWERELSRLLHGTTGGAVVELAKYR